MPKLLHRMTRKRRRPPRRDGADGRSVALVEAGIRLLARRDYEAISMAQIAREAGCSVGALYGRHSDKSAYLYQLIGRTFGELTRDAERVLGGDRWPRQSGPLVARQVVGHVVTALTSPKARGVIRATMKLATVKPETLKLFEAYRTRVTHLAVGQLAERTRQTSPAAIRIGMQMVLGTIVDAVLQARPGPMNAGSARMTEALTNMLVGYAGLSRSTSWASQEAQGEDKPSDYSILGSETPPELEDGEIAIFDPASRLYTGKTKGRQPSGKTRGRHKMAGAGASAGTAHNGRGTAAKSPARPATVKPPRRPVTAKPARPAKPTKPSRKARRRLI